MRDNVVELLAQHVMRIYNRVLFRAYLNRDVGWVGFEGCLLLKGGHTVATCGYKRRQKNHYTR
jgi:hypothetical protein